MTMLTAIDPTTGAVVREVPAATPEEITEIIGRSRTAYTTWKGTTLAERAEVLRRVASTLRERTEELAPLMTEEMGKPIGEARGEVAKSAWAAEHYAEFAPEYLADEHLESDATSSYVQYLPLGPVLGILPWNAPFWVAFRFCAPALMAGNTAIMKHDPHVPGCAEALERVFQEAGAPEGVFQTLLARTEDVEQAIRDPRVQAVSFTGSDRAGAQVAAVAASEIKPAVLELGGSDPCIVLADADLQKAAEVSALSRIINAGQSCIAAKRVIVERSVHDEFVELLAAQLRDLPVGDPRDPATKVGPIAREELRENLHRRRDAGDGRRDAGGGGLLLSGDDADRGGAGDGRLHRGDLRADRRGDRRGRCRARPGARERHALRSGRRDLDGDRARHRTGPAHRGRTGRGQRHREI
jgi:succinate-semialdehyde dehydrogenase/glutarate-semialdehyde dehydrogenase